MQDTYMGEICRTGSVVHQNKNHKGFPELKLILSEL
jgi:hypothetical protein